MEKVKEENKKPFNISRFTFNKNGQVMLLTVLVLSAVFLTATVIAGLLMVYQLSQVTAIADSAKSVFAADAAVDRALFKVFRCNGKNYPISNPILWETRAKVFCDSAANQQPISPPSIPKFNNEATYKLTIESKDEGCNKHDPNATPSNVSSIKSTGRSGKSARAFQANFGACK